MSQKKIKFSLEEEEKIIDFVKSNEILYNVKHKQFRDTEAKNRLWLQLAGDLRMDGSYFHKVAHAFVFLLINIFILFYFIAQ